jgi:menaquinone-dependent protoporphyrinogen IX oxidase
LKVWIVYDSKYGNNKQIADALGNLFSEEGNNVHVHHIKTVKPKEVIDTDILIFGGPLRMGNISFAIRRWVTNYAKILSSKKFSIKKVATWGTHLPDKPDTPQKFAWDSITIKWKTLMEVVSAEKRMSKVQGIIIKDMAGPLEENWQAIVADFAERIKAL